MKQVPLGRTGTASLATGLIVARGGKLIVEGTAAKPIIFTSVEDNQINLGWNVENSLKGEELIGVLIFNQSVKQFNLGNTSNAIELAIEALSYYSSTRIRTY